MWGINKIKQDENDGDVGSLLGEADGACHLLRKELEALRSNRTMLRNSRCKEIEILEDQYRNTKEKLQWKLPEHANIATYKRFLEYYQRDMREFHSNYIFQQETPLLSAMHRSDCVLPRQIELFEGGIYAREIYPYFRKEIQALHHDSREVTDNWMSRLSDQSEENDALYASYQTELESIEIEVKRYRGLLLQQRARNNPGKGSKRDDDENSVLSDTERSSDSDDESSSRGEAGVGFLKEALLWFSSTQRQNAVTPSTSITISDTFHGHICKGGTAFQIAANTFRLPFTSKDDDSNI